ncbi:MAG: DNA polymerase I [Fidelibacterota bacterium]
MAARKKKLFLIDGSALAYRAYFAFIRNPLFTSRGQNTSAVFGFTNSLYKILREENPELIGVIFDAPEKTFRHEKYPEYKATREKMPDEMRDQLPVIKDILHAMNIPVLEIPGYEADDVIGTISKRAEKKDILTFLVTGDKDLMQLVSDNVKIYNTKGYGKEVEVLDQKAVKEKMGVPPEHIVDLLGLAGDSSDNVPGIKGVGPKTAVKLINRFGSMDEILKNMDRIEGKVRELLKRDYQNAILSVDLVKIDTDVPVKMELSSLRRSDPDEERLKGIFRDLEFYSFMKYLEEKVPGEMAAEVQEQLKHEIVTDVDQFERFLKVLKGAGIFALDLETDSVDPMKAEIVGLSFCWENGKGWYIPIRYLNKEGSIFNKGTDAGDLSYVLENLKPILESDAIKKCGQNIKYDMNVLSRYEVYLKGIYFDTMIAAYLLKPTARSYKLDNLSLEYLNYKMVPISDLIGVGKNQDSMANVPLKKAAFYSVEDSVVTFRLMKILGEKLNESHMWDLFEKVEIPLIYVLSDMELNGVYLDIEMLKRMSHDLSMKLKVLEEQIYQLAGCKFNLNSPQQLANILFHKLNLPVVRKTKTGISTDVNVLESLKYKHEICAKILDYMHLSKLKSTYVDAIPKLVNEDTGRVHTSFNQTITATGRLSSSNPNFQNIPIRTEIGREIRKAFVPQNPGYFILSADYSQIELRLMAHLSKDPNLIESFKRGDDIHAYTASAVFGVPMSAVTPEQRRKAKIVNFGIMYGAGPFRLSTELGIPIHEAKEFINQYFKKYPKINDFIFKTLSHAREKKYVTTLLKRRRYIPEIDSANKNVRESAERAAINTPIQGTAADLIKIAMINILKKFRSKKLKGKMILQIHDELVFEVPESEVEKASRIVKKEMETAIKLSVPIKVDIGIGKSWYEAG